MFSRIAIEEYPLIEGVPTNTSIWPTESSQLKPMGNYRKEGVSDKPRCIPLCGDPKHVRYGIQSIIQAPVHEMHVSVHVLSDVLKKNRRHLVNHLG